MEGHQEGHCACLHTVSCQVRCVGLQQSLQEACRKLAGTCRIGSGWRSRHENLEPVVCLVSRVLMLSAVLLLAGSCSPLL
jgi:hypothetical protein